MSDLVSAPTVDDVMDALSNVIDPELGLDFVELGPGRRWAAAGCVLGRSRA